MDAEFRQRLQEIRDGWLDRLEVLESAECLRLMKCVQIATAILYPWSANPRVQEMEHMAEHLAR